MTTAGTRALRYLGTYRSNGVLRQEVVRKMHIKKNLKLYIEFYEGLRPETAVNGLPL